MVSTAYASYYAFTFIDWLGGFTGMWFVIYFCGNSLIKESYSKSIRASEKEPSLSTKRYLIKPYIIAWNIYTRVVSSIHALVVTYYCFYIIFNYYGYYYNSDSGQRSNGLAYVKFLWRFDNYTLEPIAGLYHFRVMSCFSGSYLLVDAIFMLLEQTEKNMLPSVLHHAVGSIGMLGFSLTGLLPYNGIYCMLTEITTIPLNITWIFAKLKPEGAPWKALGLFIYIFLGAITWLLFFVFRVVGAFWIMGSLMRDFNLILTFHWIPAIICLIANPIICVLNLMWFLKLTQLILTHDR